MDISELKSEFGALSAPEHFNFIESHESGESSSIIDRLKKIDQKSKRIIKRFYIIYFVIAAFYFGLFILNPDSDLTMNDRINGTLLFIGILLFAILGKMKYTELNNIEYNQPTSTFLEIALNRYKFWNRELNYTILIVILINIGSCRSFVINYPVFENRALDIIAFQIVFIIVLSVGIYLGYQHWKKHKKPIADEIVSLLKESE